MAGFFPAAGQTCAGQRQAQLGMEPELHFHFHGAIERRPGDLAVALHRARLASGWLTFGFNRSLDEAAAIATVEMVKLMGELHGFSPRRALSLASLVVDLRITQM